MHCLYICKQSYVHVVVGGFLLIELYLTELTMISSSIFPCSTFILTDCVVFPQQHKRVYFVDYQHTALSFVNIDILLLKIGEYIQEDAEVLIFYAILYYIPCDGCIMCV